MVFFEIPKSLAMSSIVTDFTPYRKNCSRALAIILSLISNFIRQETFETFKVSKYETMETFYWFKVFIIFLIFINFLDER